MSPSLYDFPDVYDVVMQRPPDVVEAEVRSIQGLLAARGVTRGSILELASGACAHGILLAQHGFSVTGVDRSPAMLAAAAQRAATADVAIDLVQSDVIDFSLSSDGFDGAIFMFETFQLITAYEDLLRHFRAVRRHMRSGGLYIIDFAACRHGVGTETAEWGRKTLALPNGSVEMWHEDFPGDWVEGTSHLVLHCRIDQGGTIYETTDDWRIRMCSPWDLAVLARILDGWALQGFYSWRDLSRQIADERHYFMVLEARP
jgi:SAM-dependent methyltransferase